MNLLQIIEAHDIDAHFGDYLTEEMITHSLEESTVECRVMVKEEDVETLMEKRGLSRKGAVNVLTAMGGNLRMALTTSLPLPAYDALIDKDVLVKPAEQAEEVDKK